MKLKTWLPITALLVSALCWRSEAQVQVAGSLLVNVDATSLPEGSISYVTNSGTMAGGFEAIGGGANAPRILGVGGDGTHGISFDGNDFMQHVTAPAGTLVPADAGLVGLDPTRSVEVWVFNQTVPAEETTVAWGRSATRAVASPTSASKRRGCGRSWRCR